MGLEGGDGDRAVPPAAAEKCSDPAGRLRVGHTAAWRMSAAGSPACPLGRQRSRHWPCSSWSRLRNAGSGGTSHGGAPGAGGEALAAGALVSGFREAREGGRQPKVSS